MFATQASSESAGVRFPGFGKGVVARVEVFALGEFFGQEVLFVGEFAVEAEELLFFFVQALGGRAAVSRSTGGEYVC